MSDLVADAVDGGDRRRILEVLARKLASAIDAGPEPKDLAALVLRLERVTAELAGLGVGRAKEMSFEDRLAARREAREAANG